MRSQKSPGNIMRRNNVVVLGSGPKTLVLAHGLGCDQRIWHKVVPMLAASFRLVLFDYVGAGESDLQQYDPQKYQNLEGYAHDLLDVIDCLRLSKPYLLSHSASGSIGVLAEQIAPGSFERLLMLNPSPRYVNDGGYYGGFEREDIDGLLELMEENYFQWANVMAAQAMRNESRPELAERLVRSFQQARPDIMLQFARAILYSDYRKAYADIPCAVSVILNEDDAIVPMVVGEYLQQHMKQCDLRIVEAQGHYPQLSQPAHVVECVRQILSKEVHA